VGSVPWYWLSGCGEVAVFIVAGGIIYGTQDKEYWA
jgi:hypothetical protein